VREDGFRGWDTDVATIPSIKKQSAPVYYRLSSKNRRCETDSDRIEFFASLDREIASI